MKFYTTLLACLITCAQAAQAQNNLVIFSPDGDKFYLMLNGEQQNSTPKANIKITGLNDPALKAKIVFEDNTLANIDQTVYFNMDEPNTEYTHQIKIKKGKRVLRQFSFKPIAEVKPQTNQQVIIYGQPETITTTTTTTVVNNPNSNPNPTPAPNPNANVSVNVNTNTTNTTTTTAPSNDNVNINMNVSDPNGNPQNDPNFNMNVNVSGNPDNPSFNMNVNVSDPSGNPSNNSNTNTDGNFNLNMNVSDPNGNPNTDPNMNVNMNVSAPNTNTNYSTTTTTTSTTTTTTNPAPAPAVVANTNGNCVNTMTEATLKKTIDRMKATMHDSDHLSISKNAVKKNCATTAQIKEMAKVIVHEFSRVEFIEEAYKYCSDRENYDDLLDIFTFPSSRDAIYKLME
jgi:hypothetical protein